MSKNLTDEQRKHILDFQKEAKDLLRDPKKFTERFDTLFSKYDKNRDGTIEFNEYQEFMKEFLISMGRTKIQPTLIYSYFERADSDALKIKKYLYPFFSIQISFLFNTKSYSKSIERKVIFSGVISLISTSLSQ